jgi:hypothetical protein
MFIRLLGK